MMKFRNATALTFAAAIAIAAPVQAGETASSPGATTYVINIENGATVKSPVLVQFGLKGMGVAPAGIEQDGTGHHHILLDTEAYGDAMANDPIPADDNHIHFGGGQTETTLELAPGPHSIQLVLGDKDHIPHNPPVVSERIEFTVE